jgi:hypothetical protein
LDPVQSSRPGASSSSENDSTELISSSEEPSSVECSAASLVAKRDTYSMQINTVTANDQSDACNFSFSLLLLFLSLKSCDPLIVIRC